MHVVGRETERRILDGLLDGARAGEGSALLLLGEAGIGTSALLHHAARRAREREIRVLRAAGRPGEEDLDHAALLDLLAPELGRIDRLPAAQARALGAALTLAEPAGATDRLAVRAGVRSLLAAGTPVLVVVDDAHLLDDGSAAALAFAARRPPAGAVVLLAARAGCGAEARFAGVARHELGPLADEDARELLVHEGSAAGPLADAVVDRLVATAGGNPLALVELPHRLSAAQRDGREPVLAPLPPTPAAERAYAPRLDALDADARLALLAAAVAEGAGEAALAGALAALGLGPDALAPPERAGLVRVGRGVVVAHPLLRCVVVARSAAADRRRVHLALAAVVPDAATRAWQLALAATGPDDAVADALAAAGREGPQAGAGAALARAAELTTDPTLAARRRLDAARAFAAGGHPDQALALLGAAEEAVTPGGDRLLAADLRRLRSRIELRRGGPAGVHAALAAEAQAVRDLDPARAAWLLVEAAAVHLAAGDHEALLEEATAAGLLAGEDPDGALGLLARVLVAGAHAGRGDDEAAEAVLGPLVGRLLEADLAEGPAEAAALAGHLAVWAGRWDRAAALLDRLVAAARGAGAVAELIHPLAVHALLDLRRGRWTSALADAGESARLARATGNRGLLAFSAGVLACVEAVHGRSDDAHAHAREALALTEAFEGSATACYALHALALDALGRGDAELGAEWLTRLERAAAAATLGRAVVPFGADRVEALARAGRPEVAHEALEHFADGQGGGHWAPAALARCRGLLADGGEFEDHFETALALHARDGQPWEKARTQLCYGERLRRERRRADARELLAEALVTFERLGSEPWAERARIELRATGTAAAAPELAQEPTAAAVAAAGLDDLTAHELQIARLVAYGMTNREVGAKLFLSPKTIEYHLSAIYRKLELRSRTQLAKLMASELVPAG